MPPIRWLCLRLLLTLALPAIAHAGQLSLRFVGGGDEVTLAAGETATLEVVWQMQSSDTTKSGVKLTGASLRFRNDDENGDPLSQALVVESVSGLPGWDLSATQGIGDEFTEANFFFTAIGTNGTGISANGTAFQTTFATVVVRNDDPQAGDAFVTFRHASPDDPLPAAENGINTWALRWQEEVGSPGQYDLGQGNPGDEDEIWDPYHGYEDFEPLVIHLTGGAQQGVNCPPPSAVGDLQTAYDVEFYLDQLACQNVRRMAFYGKLMNEGATDDAAVADWILDWGSGSNNVFGVSNLTLQLERDNDIGTGHSRVYVHRQLMGGNPVDCGFTRIVVRHGDPESVAYAAGRLCMPGQTGLRDVEVLAEDAVSFVQALDDYDHLTEWSGPELVVFCDEQTQAVRVWKFMGTLPDLSAYESYTFFVDAYEANLVHIRSNVSHAGIQGQVRGYATPGVWPDLDYNPAAEVPLEGAGIWLFGVPRTSGNAAFCDSTGAYAIAHSGGEVVTVRADLFGPWVTVTSAAGGELSLEALVSPPGTQDFHFGQPSEFATAQINALVQVTAMHDFYKQRQPDFDGLDFPLKCVVNKPAVPFCDAQDLHGPALGITFTTGNGTCPNAAYSSVIAHEYGHIIGDRLGFAEDDGMWEGFADTVSVLRFDDPVLFRDGGGPGSFSRDVVLANAQVPAVCDPNQYRNGLVLAGSWWDIKLQLQEALSGAEGLEIARQLFTDWSQLTQGGTDCHAANALTAIEVLAADDLAYGDADITNSTPHDCAICVGFGKHGIPCPAVLLAEDCTDNGVPDRCELPDCNNNDIADSCDIAAGTSEDCTGNAAPDECEPDCNDNDVADSCDIAAGTSLDCTENGVPDECEPDCNENAIADSCDIAAGTSLDCPPLPCPCAPPKELSCQCMSPGNGIPDACEPDCNGNSVADSCEIARDGARDCNANGVPDGCEVSAGTSADCNDNDTPDECEDDCNENVAPDACDIDSGTSADCDSDGIPDECQAQSDCNANQVTDRCETAAGTAPDCNGNFMPDACDLSPGTSVDCTNNGVLDECEPDCNLNGTADSCDIATLFSPDCDGNATPDECDLLRCQARDCNGNATPDSCDISGATSEDLNEDGIPDECVVPPLIVSVASVGYHASSTAGGPPSWPGGFFEFCVDPELGAIEPRIQTPTTGNGNTQLFLRVTFDQAVEEGSLAIAGVIPDTGLDAEITYPPGSPETVEIRFKDAVGTAAAAPAGSYTIDVAGIASVASGARAGGACSAFRICYATGDVNCDGRATYADVNEIQRPANFDKNLSREGVNPRADVSRNGYVFVGDANNVQSASNLMQPRFPAFCSCSCAPPGECGCREADFDRDVDVDLRDYADFQVCFGPDASSLCLCTFDLEPAGGDGDVDLADYDEFASVLNGIGTCSIGTAGLGAGAGGLLGEVVGEAAGPAPTEAPQDASAPQAPPWTHAAGNAAIELQPRGGGPAEIALVSGLTYQVHYRGVGHPVAGYTLSIAALDGGCAISSAEPASMGAWSNTGLFGLGVMIEGGEVRGPEVDCDDSAYAHDIIMDDMAASSAAGDGMHLCNIHVAQPSELQVHLILSFTDYDQRATYDSQGVATFLVLPTVPDVGP